MPSDERQGRGSNGARPCLSRIDRSAPLDSSSLTTGSDSPAWPARCRAVCPSALTALTSAPRSRHRAIASSAAFSEAARPRPRGAGRAARRRRGKHQRRRAVCGLPFRIRAAVEQQPHRGHVARLGRPHQRRRARAELSVADVVVAREDRRFQRRVGVAAVREDLLQQVEVVDAARRLARRPVDHQRLRVHVHERVDRRHARGIARFGSAPCSTSSAATS